MPRSAPGPATGWPITSTFAAGRRMLGPQPGNQPQDRALAAAAGAQDADEFAFVDQVFNDERDVANRREFVRRPALKVLVTSRNSTTCGSRTSPGWRTPSSTRPMPTCWPVAAARARFGFGSVLLMVCVGSVGCACGCRRLLEPPRERLPHQQAQVFPGVQHASDSRCKNPIPP